MENEIVELIDVKYQKTLPIIFYFVESSKSEEGGLCFEKSKNHNGSININCFYKPICIYKEFVEHGQT